ncbi:MAG: hypothetical protein QXE31_04475 [Candidatus Woesearchaeota archaeon]
MEFKNFISGKNKIILLLLISIIIIFIIFFTAYNLNSKNNPKNWIIKNNISVYKATDKLSYQNYIGQQTFDLDTVFIHSGIYLGKPFKSFYEENNQIKIRFSEQLKKDNIPDAYIFEKKENEDLVVYIFLDEDWKKQIPDTNIIWGKNYQYVKKFSFNEKNEIQKGIYMEKIIDDPERFMNNYKIHLSSIFVGKITKEDIENNDYSHSIFIRFL